MAAKVQYAFLAGLFALSLVLMPLGLLLAIISGDWRALLLAAPGTVILHSWLK